MIIVDDADLLVPAARNALLKTLEEPPPRSQFVLVTARPDMLLDNGPLAVSSPAVRPARGGRGRCHPGAAARNRRDGRPPHRRGGRRPRRPRPADGVERPGGDPLGSLGGGRAAAVGVGGARRAGAAGRRSGLRRGQGLEAAAAADRREPRERLRMLASLLRDVASVAAAAAVPLANADLDGALRELGRRLGRRARPAGVRRYRRGARRGGAERESEGGGRLGGVPDLRTRT